MRIYYAIRRCPSLVYVCVHVPRGALSCLYFRILTVNENAYPKLYRKIERHGPAVRWSCLYLRILTVDKE